MKPIISEQSKIQTTIKKKLINLKIAHENLSWFQSWFFPTQLGSALKAYKPENAALENAWPIYDSYINHTSPFQRWFGNFFSFLRQFTTSPLTKCLDRNKNSLNKDNFSDMVFKYYNGEIELVGSQALARLLASIDSDDDTPVAEVNIDPDNDDEPKLSINNKTLGELQAALRSNFARLSDEEEPFADITPVIVDTHDSSSLNEEIHNQDANRRKMMSDEGIASSFAPKLKSVSALSMFSTQKLVASHYPQAITGNFTPLQ